jgi:serine/threonine protein kinase
LGNRYRALKILGQGGFGRTFLAEDVTAPRHPYCVIKQSLPLRHAAPENRERASDLFRQEARRLGQLGQHPQIPYLLDQFEQENGQFLVQEFIDGPDLEAMLQEQGPFSEGQVRFLLQDLLPVLDYIHQHHVIHRDIKPANIIRPVNSEHLVLVDFGASKIVSASALAQTGTVIGSAGYAAPEQTMGKAEYASDLYSLGVTCAHLLTGLHPFDLYSVSEDGWIWPQCLPQPISQGLHQVLEGMLKKATSRRYQTALQVLDDLQRLPTTLALQPPSQAAPVTTGPNLPVPPPKRKISTRQPRRPESGEANPWRYVQSIAGHEGPITALAFAPDGQLLVTGGTDRSIKLWNLGRGEPLHTFPGRSLWFGNGHGDRVHSLVFTDEGDTLVSGSDDGLVKLWDIPNRKLKATLERQGWDITTLAISQDGRILATGSSDGAVHLWDMQRQIPRGDFIHHRDRITSLLIHPDHRTIISASADRLIRVWDLHTGQLLNTLVGHGDGVSAIAPIPGWHSLVSSSWDSTLKLWDLDSRHPVQTLNGHAEAALRVAVSPAGDYIASGGQDGLILLWELEWVDGLPQVYQAPPWRLHQSWGIVALAFSPDGLTLVSSSNDETVSIWRQMVVAL